MTRVLPLPAPANTRTGPSAAVTASRWGGFRSRRIDSASSKRLLQLEFLGAQSPLVHSDVELLERPALGIQIAVRGLGQDIARNRHHLRLEPERRGLGARHGQVDRDLLRGNLQVADD